MDLLLELNSFQGVIGKPLPAVAEMEWNSAFKPILACPPLEDLFEEVFRDLSEVSLVIPAVMSSSLSPISHSRWLQLELKCT